MAWEWVAPVSTATVGVVGVAGTYWSARMGRNATADQARAQREHALQERSHIEKRTAYVAFLEAVTSANRTVTTIRRMPRTPDTLMERRDLRTAALTELALRRAHLRLSGPPQVRHLARQSHQHMAEALNAAVGGKEPDRSNLHEAALLAAMKLDLNYELAPMDEEALAQVDQVDGADSSRTEDES